MNVKQRIASELLVMAKELIGMDFPTQDAMDKYLKDHPDADKSNHRVVKTEKTEPKKDEPKKEEPKKDTKKVNLPTALKDDIDDTVLDMDRNEFTREWETLGGGTQSDAVNTAKDVGIITEAESESYWDARDKHDPDKREKAWAKVRGKIYDAMGAYWDKAHAPD